MKSFSDLLLKYPLYLMTCGLFLFLLFPVADGYAETFSWDVNTGATKIVPGVKNFPELPITEVPGQNIPGMEVGWEVAISHHIEIHFKKPMPLVPFTEVVVHARIFAPEGCSARSLNVRFQDKDGECLQFPVAVDFRKGGFFDVIWNVKPGGASGSWGEPPLNRVIDMPASIYNIAVEYDQKVPSGRFWLLSLDAETVYGEPVESIRPLYSFDDSFLLQLLWGETQTEVVDGVLKFTSMTTPTGFRERKDAILRYEEMPPDFLVDLELSGGPAKIKAFLKDNDNQKFTSSVIDLTSGRQTVRLHFDLAKNKWKAPLQLDCIEIHPENGQKIDVTFHSVSSVVSETVPQAVDFELDTGNPIHILACNGPDSLKTRFTNRSVQTADCLVELTFENFFGEKYQEEHSLVLTSGESRTLTTQWQPNSLGHWNVTATIREKNNLANRAVKSCGMAYFTPAGPTPGRATGFLFSICTHTERWSERDQQLEVEASGLCGAKVMRVGGGWASLEPQEGVWNWDMLDSLVDRYAEKGMELQVIMGTTPKWAAPPETRNSPVWTVWGGAFPTDIEYWKEYVRQLGSRYRGRIRFYETWNEPDIEAFSRMSLEEYCTIQKTAYEAMKEVDPDAIVMSGGFATLADYSGLLTKTFQRDFLDEAKGYFDIHAYHEHGWFDSYQRLVDTVFLPIRKETGTDNVPWYSNETAMTSVHGQEKRQATTLYKKLIFAWARGSIGYTWYDLRNDGYDPDYGEHHFGMVTNDFYPKEVYSVYNMLASVFANAHFVKDYKPDTDLWGFCFADGDTLLIPVWNESETGSSKNLIFKTDAKKAAVLDVMGNEKPIPLISGRLCIDASDIPQTLKLEGASEASFEGELLKSNSEDVVIPGRDWTLSLNVINPLDHETPIEISVDNLRGGDCPDGPTRKLTLPADTATSVDFHFIMNKEEAGDSLVTVNYQIPETSWRGVLYLPVKVAGSIPAKDEVGRAPDFAMNRQNQMTSLIAADPSTAHRLWKGPEDLSGEIWLNKSDNFLNVRVVVNDDIHSQPYSGDDLIQGDSLRVYFCPDKTGKIEGVGLSLTDNSTVVKQQFVPDSGKMETVESDSFVGSVHREGHQTLYQLSIPSDFLNRTSDDRDQGVRFNVILDDNDGEGPDSRMHLTGVLPDGTNAESWPLIIFE